MPTTKKTITPRTKSRTQFPIRVDSDVVKPRSARTDPDSMLSRILDLQVGEVFSRAERLPGDKTVWGDILEAKARERATMGSQVGRANKEGGRRDDSAFTLAIGHFRANDGDVMIVSTVTRIQ